MTTDVYRPPTNPTDPTQAALDHLVRAPEIAGTIRLRGPLQALATALDVEGVLSGRGWPDAKRVAAIVAFDAIAEDHPEVVLRDRARVLVTCGRGGWDDPLGVAHILDIAAKVLETW